MRVLIDTTFILPALGVDVGERVLELIGKFHNHEIYFVELSTLEAMWVIRRLIKKGAEVDLKRVKIGLRSVRETYRLLRVPTSAYLMAIKEKGHEDLIDLTLYYTAKSYGLKFLSIDQKLKEFDKDKVIVDEI
ncbi:PIN domain-containing protein [Metallosphaera hakonensis]|uniref:PIN domain-containing protein n=1 Tax=Metallosphaera hakonensis JCM 8857 = DSM 7519 TaxID=1293036 RepID=A0A2U9ISM7_9CREN|nr:PIN domain-containing protein [Metallosphaera hakonensis]AWR99049.1 PIN domain-containing protein [Metallosphaera hakonensis JCM 8857 = DSM 7519]